MNSCLFCVHSNDGSYREGEFDKANADFVKIRLKELLECLDSIEGDSSEEYQYKIALLHHNILPERGKGLIDPNPEDFTAILKRYGFDIILCGHLHSRKVNSLNNVMLLGAGSFGVKKDLKYTLNDVNVIKVKLDTSIPAFQDNPIRKVSVETFEMNYKSYNDAIRPIEKQIRFIEMSNKTYESLKKHYLESIFKTPDEKISATFKNEVITSGIDRKLFLSILFLSNSFDFNKFKRVYNDLVDYLEISNFLDFQRHFNHFLEQKVIKIEVGRIKFSNLLYHQVLSSLLSENGKFKRILEKVLIFSSNNESLASDVVWVVVKDYFNFSEEVRELLFNISKEDYTTFEDPINEIAWAVMDNYKNLPKAILNLLFLLAESEKTAKEVARALTHYYEKLEPPFRNDLLKSLSKKKLANPFIYKILNDSSNEIPEEVRAKVIKNLYVFKFVWNYDQPFKTMVGKEAYVGGHALELLYFHEEDTEWVMESRSYDAENFTKHWYRWIFTEGLPKEISDLIGPTHVDIARKKVLFIPSSITIELPFMGGLVIEKPYRDQAGNRFFCIINPSFFT
ncbi:MAG: metallophosphoesterase family protein [Promethearchaeota archaeon]